MLMIDSLTDLIIKLLKEMWGSAALFCYIIVNWTSADFLKTAIWICLMADWLFSTIFHKFYTLKG